MRSEPGRITLADLGELAQAVPHQMGYQPGLDQFAVVALSGRVVVGAAAATWTGSTNHEVTLDLVNDVKTITRTFGRRDPDRFVVFGYGPDGAARARTVASELHGQTDVLTSAVAVEAGRAQVFDPYSGAWRQVDLRPAVEAGLAQAAPPAARSRDALVEQVAPYAAPRWSAPPVGEQLRIEQSLPSARAVEAVGLVAAIESVDPQTLREAQSRLGHLMNSHTIVRDMVLMAASSRPEVAGAFVDWYLGAPDEYRDVAATTAGVLTFLEDRATAPALDILGHVSADSPQHQLADLAARVIESGATPEDVRRGLVIDTPPALASADRAFQAQRSQDLLARSAAPHASRQLQPATAIHEPTIVRTGPERAL